jgi:branched-chain amino acid transport system substrate-binding protein
MAAAWAKRGVPLVLAACVTVVTACSSSSGSGSSKAGSNTSSGPVGSSPASGAASDPHSYTLGLLTDLTGLAASAEKSTPQGVKAGVGLANANGYKIKYVTADATSTPGGALQAAHKLVEQDHVTAVIAISGLTFAASSYLTAKGVPVIGAATDGPEWLTSRNMFSIFGFQDFHTVQSNTGDFLKLVGAKNLAAVGYSVPQSSSLAAKSAGASAQHAGIKVGYLNTQFPLGSTDVGPLTLAIKNAHSDALSAALEENTSFALITALRQQGVKLVAPILSVGYGADLVDGGPGVQQAAQDAYFLLSYEPVEMQTPATKRLVSALSTYAGVTTEPSLNEYLGYVSVDAFVSALKKTGSNPSSSALITALLGMTHYTADGLFGDHSIDFSMSNRGQFAGAENCTWYLKYSGTAFHLVKGADPLCGTTLADQKVS